jgi:eukaryotic-like serine/threonine-protein kinase
VFSAGIILHEMLTTEKLFRGDTEFALMEKVRKAEVPPPSGFNRRVTPELDAITLRALARDVADRYQNATQLAADLDALIAGYRFDPKELRQLMRQLFRKEYAKEIEETETALDSQPNTNPSFASARQSQPMGYVDNPTQTMPSVKIERVEAETDDEVPSIPAAPPPPQPHGGGHADDRPKGFWGSLFKRKK